MNRDHIEGSLRNLKGRGRTVFGAVAGRARPQVEGAYEQVAGVAQAAYGRTRERAEDIYEDGYRIADQAVSRGRHLRDEADRRGRALALQAEENRGTTLALVAAAAFGLGWLLSRRR